MKQAVCGRNDRDKISNFVDIILYFTPPSFMMSKITHLECIRNLVQNLE